MHKKRACVSKGETIKPVCLALAYEAVSKLIGLSDLVRKADESIKPGA